jgi:hypothetical protein
MRSSLRQSSAGFDEGFTEPTPVDWVSRAMTFPTRELGCTRRLFEQSTLPSQDVELRC